MDSENDIYLPKTNRGSWEAIHRQLDLFTHKSATKPKKIFRAAIDFLADKGLTEWFRIGMSMYEVVLSTKEAHGLEVDARVTLQIKGDKVRVCYSHFNVSDNKPEFERTCTVKKVVATTLPFLEKLWLETKSSQPLPEVLRSR